jgi:signal transduction histidine kinase
MRCVQDSNAMIQDVLEVSRGIAELKLEQVDMKSLLMECLEQVLLLNSSCKIALKLEKLEEVVINADRQKLKRVFLNILNNALEAMVQGGTLELKAEHIPKGPRCPQGVRCTIANSGSFISAEDIQTLFEPFFTKGKHGGTGLGLAIAKKVVEAHSGNISCRSVGARGETEAWVEFRVEV